MSIIGGSPLRVIGRALRFLDGRSALTEMELNLPAQPVYDISRQSALGSIQTGLPAAGLVSVDQDNVHPAGGETIESQLDPYANLDPNWGLQDERWMWLMGFAGSVTSIGMLGAGASAVVSVNIPALGPAYTRRDYLLEIWTNAVTITTDLSATFPASLFAPASSAATMGGQQRMMPFPLPPGTRIGFRTIAIAANPGTMRLETLCWLGPMGVYPPGLS